MMDTMDDMDTIYVIFITIIFNFERRSEGGDAQTQSGHLAAIIVVYDLYYISAIKQINHSLLQVFYSHLVVVRSVLGFR